MQDTPTTIQPPAGTPEQAAWRSLRYPLLWKEWRQQRWVFLAMTVLGPLILVLGLRWLTAAAVIVSAGVVLIGCPLLLGANTFAGERDNGSAAFLQSLPVSSKTVFRAKLLLLLLLTAAVCLVWAGATGIVIGLREPKWLQELRQIPVLGPAFRSVVGTLLGTGTAVTVLALAATAIIASGGASAMATVITTLIVLVLALLWLGCVGVFIEMMQHPWHPLGWFWAAILSAALLTAARAWQRRDRSRRLLRTAAGLLVLAVAPAAVAAIFYFHLVLLISPEQHLRFWPGRNSLVVVQQPSSGLHISRETPRHLAGSLRLPGPYGQGRAFVCDARTGRATWFTRLRASEVAGEYFRQELSPAWSPDGGKCLLWRRNGLYLWPLRKLHPARFLPLRYRQEQTPFLFDTERATFKPVPGPVPRSVIPGRSGWFDNDTLFWLENDGKNLVFAKMGQDRRRIPAVPASLEARGRPRNPYPFSGWYSSFVFPGKGVYRWVSFLPVHENGDRKLVLLRYHPDRAAAEVRTFRHEWQSDMVRVSQMSADGSVALAFERTGPSRDAPYALYRISVDTGTARELHVPDDMALTPRHSSQQTPLLLPDGDRIVFLSPSGVSVYDTRNSNWTRHELPITKGAAWAHVEWAGSRSGSGKPLAPDGRQLALNVEVPRKPGRFLLVFNLDTGLSRRLPVEYTGEYTGAFQGWLNNKELLIQSESGLWAVSSDGSGRRRLL